MYGLPTAPKTNAVLLLLSPEAECADQKKYVGGEKGHEGTHADSQVDGPGLDDLSLGPKAFSQNICRGGKTPLSICQAVYRH